MNVCFCWVSRLIRPKTSNVAVLLRRSLSQGERQGGFIDHYLVGIYTTRRAAFFAAFSLGGVPWFTANSNTMVQTHNESNGQPIHYKHKPSRWSQKGNTVLFGRLPSELYRFRWGSNGHETKILVNCPRVLASHEMPAAAAVAAALRQRRLETRAEGDGWRVGAVAWRFAIWPSDKLYACMFP